MSQAASQHAGVSHAPLRGARLARLSGPASAINAAANSASINNGSLAAVDPSERLPAFVGGPENRLLVAVMNQLVTQLAGKQGAEASSPAQPTTSLPSPLLLVGQHGSGKSHLALGLVELWQSAHGADSASYYTAPDFGREFAAAIDRGEVREFRRLLRRHQLLVIDDVHKLGDSPHRQMELRHTLDSCTKKGGLVVITSLGPLAETTDFDRPLLSRLAAGLTLEIAPPGVSARREILRSAAEVAGCQISEDALSSLAEQLPPDPPKVLRAAIELRRRVGTRIDVQAANRLLDQDKPTNSPPLGDILRIVARYHKVPLKVLTSASRRASVVTARSMAIYLARELTPLSYAQIGLSLGGRDHTTIMHNYRRVVRQLPKDRALRSAIDELRRLIAP